MVLIEEVLWNIFTYYSLRSNPKDPSKLHSMALLKLCKDILTMDPTMVETALTQQDFLLIYTSILKSPSKKKQDRSDKLDFEEFLKCLIKISLRCYPTNTSKEASMQQLLMDNILPLALRREPTNITHIMKQSNIESLLKSFDVSLINIFKFYAITSEEITKNINMAISTTSVSRIFDDQKELINDANMKCKQQAAISKQMSYNDFIRFVHEFGLVKNLSIPIIEFGDIFLTVTSFTNFTTTLRRIDCKEFVEAIVRIALLAHKDSKDSSDEEKIKALFLTIWRYMQEELRQHMLQYGTINGGSFHDYKEAFFRESEIFLNKFKSIWKNDGYRNYLTNIEDSLTIQSLSPHKRTLNDSTSKMNNSNILTTTAATTPIRKSYKEEDIISTPLTSIGHCDIKNNNTTNSKKKIIYTSSLMRRLKGLEAISIDDNDDCNTSILDASNIKMNTSDNVSIKSNTISDIGTISEMRTKKDILINTLLDKMEESESFVVKDCNNSEYRIVISSKESFDGGRITPIDLRKLFIHKPDLAAVIYDSMVDAKVTKEINDTDNLQTIHEGYDDEDDGLDELIGDLSIEDMNREMEAAEIELDNQEKKSTETDSLIQTNISPPTSSVPITDIPTPIASSVSPKNIQVPPATTVILTPPAPPITSTVPPTIIPAPSSPLIASPVPPAPPTIIPAPPAPPKTMRAPPAPPKTMQAPPAPITSPTPPVPPKVIPVPPAPPLASSNFKSSITPPPPPPPPSLAK